MEICERMGDEPDPDKIPPDYSDLPLFVQEAMEIYSKLPDTYTGGNVSTYAGKNVSALPFLLDTYLITNASDRMHITDIILHLDRVNVKNSVEKAKKELSKTR